MKKVLLVGGLGYIGSRLLHFNRKDYSIDVMDNLMYGQNHVLEGVCPFFGKFYKQDIRTADWSSILGQYTHIIHLAALVGAPICDKLGEGETYQINQLATERLVGALKPTQKIVYINSNSGYGTSLDSECTEESKISPLSSYATTKYHGELAVLRHPNSVVFRCATVMGRSPKNRLDLMVNDFAYKAYFNKLIKIYEGGFRRNMIHISDVCRALLLGLEDNYHGVYNLGNDAYNCSKSELAHSIARRFGAKVEECEGEDKDKRDYNVSSAKLYKTGYAPYYSLKDTLDELEQLFVSMPSDPQQRERLVKTMRNV